MLTCLRIAQPILASLYQSEYQQYTCDIHWVLVRWKFRKWFVSLVGKKRNCWPKFDEEQILLQCPTTPLVMFQVLMFSPPITGSESTTNDKSIQFWALMQEELLLCKGRLFWQRICVVSPTDLFTCEAFSIPLQSVTHPNGLFMLPRVSCWQMRYSNEECMPVWTFLSTARF